MSAHSGSLVAFGRLLSDVVSGLAEGGPVSEALERARQHFSANAMILQLDRPNTATRIYLDRQLEAEHFATPDIERLALAEALSRSHLKASASETSGEGRNALRLSVYRSREAGAFSDEEQATLEVLLTQIARTLDLAVKLKRNTVQNSLYSDVLERLNIGMVLLGEGGLVHSVSPVARRLLLSKDGLMVSSGRLRAVQAGEDRGLQAAITAVSGPEAAPARGVALTKSSGLRSLGVMIRPIDSQSRSGAKVAVYLRDSDLSPELGSEFVRQIFDLTPAEAAVTNRLTAGLSLEDAATSLQISRNTARAHLRSIFSKSGITRQTELVRLVLNSAVLLGDSQSERPARAG